MAGQIYFLGGFSGCSGVRFAPVPTRGAWAPGPSHPARALFIHAVRVPNQRHTELLVIIHANHFLCSTALPQSPRRDSAVKKNFKNH